MYSMRKNRKDYYITPKQKLVYNLRSMREDRDLTQREIANMLYMDRSTYTYNENGKSLPDSFTIIKLAKFYGVDIRCILMNLRK